MPTAVAHRAANFEQRPRRTLAERIVAGFPGLYRAAAKVVWRLPPTSRIRAFFAQQLMQSAFAAITRDDFVLPMVWYGPDVVYEFNPELVTLGLPERVDGRDAHMRTLREFRATWEEWRFTPSYAIDHGDGTAITLSHAWYRGGASGVEFEIEYAQVLEMRDGIVTRERDFTEWRQAIEAAGMDAGVLERLGSLPPGGVMRL